MNEQIKELLTQATHDVLGVKQVDQEKFALSIVGACASIYDRIDNGNDHLGTHHYLRALQLHFGIKRKPGATDDSDTGC